MNFLQASIVFRAAHTADDKFESLPSWPFRGINKDNREFHFFSLKQIVLQNIGFGQFAEILEGLGRSSDLVATISTYPGTSPMPW